MSKGLPLATGHPFAATGGRILATAAKLLRLKGHGRALISICAAGGQGGGCHFGKKPPLWVKIKPQTIYLP